MDHLKQQRAFWYLQMKGSHALLVRARKLHESLERRYVHERQMYEKFDHELALIDGRLTKVEPERTGKRVKVDPTAAYIDKFVNASADERARMINELVSRTAEEVIEEVENEEID